MNRWQDDLLRSALAGASTGGRTFTAVEALALSARPGTTAQPDATLAKPWVRGVFGVLALGELVGDKLPITPSRLEPQGLYGRLLFGGLCGAVVARRDPEPALTGRPAEPVPGGVAGPVPGGVAGPVPGGVAGPAQPESPRRNDVVQRSVACVLAGVVSAAAASWAGARWRSWAASKTRHDWIGAQVEDAVVAALAARAARAR